MKSGYVGLFLLVLLALSFANYHITYSGNVATISFDKYPAINVSFVCYDNGFSSKKSFPLIKSPLRTICTNVTNLTYDNTTWLVVETHNASDGILHLSGKTEDASICMAARKLGRDMNFWKTHCFTNISIYINGKFEKSVLADANGNWNVSVSLKPGTNLVRIVATDIGGNTAEKRISVSWHPSLAGMVVYYLKKPEYLALVWIVIFVILGILFLIWRGEKKRARNVEIVKQTLTPLFDKELLLINKFGFEVIENPEYHNLVRQILHTDPFYSFLKLKKKKMPKDKEKHADWFKSEVEKPLFHMLLDHDPNFNKAGANAMTMLFPVYREIAKEILKGE